MVLKLQKFAEKVAARYDPSQQSSVHAPGSSPPPPPALSKVGKYLSFVSDILLTFVSCT